MVLQPTADEPLHFAEGELRRQRKAELVDKRSGDQGRVEHRPALAENVADPLVPQRGQRGREIHGPRATLDYVGNKPGLCQHLCIGAPRGDHDRPLATP